MELYLARRYFGMSMEEWEALPWWQPRALREGLENEGILKGGEEGGTYTPPPAPESAPAPAASPQYQPWELDPLGVDDSAFRRMGITVIDGGKGRDG
jgi:hypothetical protein